MCDIPDIESVSKKYSLWRFLILKVRVGGFYSYGFYFVGWKKVYGFKFEN